MPDDVPVKGRQAPAPAPARQLAGFVAKFSPGIAAQARAVLAKMRQRLPGAIELVYDNYNALAIGFGPTERTGDAIFSIAVFPRWVSLFFLRGAGLPDPTKLLRGSGSLARHVVLTGPDDLDRPAIKALMAAAVQRAPTAWDPKQPRRLLIKSVAAKQRSRRPAEPERCFRKRSP